MKKTYSIRVEEEQMKAIDETAKSLGLTRSAYLVFLASSIEGILGSQDERSKQVAGVVDSLAKLSSIGK